MKIAVFMKSGVSLHLDLVEETFGDLILRWEGCLKNSEIFLVPMNGLSCCINPNSIQMITEQVGSSTKEGKDAI